MLSKAFKQDLSSEFDEFGCKEEDQFVAGHAADEARQVRGVRAGAHWPRVSQGYVELGRDVYDVFRDEVVVHDRAFRCWRDRKIEIALHSTRLLRRLWEVKNGSSAKLTMSVDARSKDYVCVWTLNTVVV